MTWLSSCTDGRLNVYGEVMAVVMRLSSGLGCLCWKEVRARLTAGISEKFCDAGLKYGVASRGHPRSIFYFLCSSGFN